MNISSIFYTYCSLIPSKFFNLVKIAKNSPHFFFYCTVENLIDFCYNIFTVTCNIAAPFVGRVGIASA